MGQIVMVLGASGSGKSTSLRSFNQGEVGIFSVAGKRLPFKKQLDVFNTRDYNLICKTLQGNKRLAYVIDDSTYLMQFDMFQYAKTKGYEKFTDMAMNFERLLEYGQATSDDTIVYLLHHPRFGEDGGSEPQTVGKMLDNQLNIVGLFPIVIECEIRESEHVFITDPKEGKLAKSPVDLETGVRMLPEVMPNDLKQVDTLIREFWGMRPLENALQDAGKE